MKEQLNKIVTGIIGVVAGAVMTLGGTSGASTTAHAVPHAARVVACAAVPHAHRVVLRHAESLNTFSRTHGGHIPADIIAATIQCEGGFSANGPGWGLPWYHYVNHGRWGLKLRRGTILWTP